MVLSFPFKVNLTWNKDQNIYSKGKWEIRKIYVGLGFTLRNPFYIQ